MSIKSVVTMGATLLLTLVVAPGVANAMIGAPVEAGYNYYHELGLELGEYVFTPHAIPGLPSVVSGAVGPYDAFAVLPNDTVDGWGYNDYGEVGDGKTSEVDKPVPVSGLSNVASLAVGDYHTLALTNEGTVEAWGYNEYGQLGNGGSDAESTTPELVKGLSGVTQVAAGCYDSFALAGGRVYAWGDNEAGELGDGTKEEQKKPQLLTGISGVKSIAAGCYHTLALLENGETVEAWGENVDGDVNGNPTTEDVVSPVAVTGLSGVAAVGAGESFDAALMDAGTVEAWGYNKYHELGDGGTSPHDTPQPVPGVSGATSISVGGLFVLALHANGTVQGWGYGEYGELGNGLEEQEVPTAETLPFTSVVGLTPASESYSSMVIEGATGSASPTSLGFESRIIGTTSAAQSVTVTNGGPAAMSISGDSLSGSGAGAFKRTADTCAGATLAAGATCTISYAFAPTAVGTDDATLAIASSSFSALPAVALGGTGTPHVPPVLGSLLLTSSAFPAAHSGPSAVNASASGTYIIYTDTQAATTTFTVQQKLAGVYHGSGKSRVCATAPKHHKHGAKRCSYSKTLGSFTHTDTVGTNALRFTGRVAGKALARGSYRLSAVAVSPEGSSTTQGATFTVTH